QRIYEENRKKSTYLKLKQCSLTFFEKLDKAVKSNVRRHSVDTFVHEYKEEQPTETIPSTKTLYRYIAACFISIKPIDLPKMVSIRKRSKYKTTVNKKPLGKFIEERPETINNRSEFGHWEIDLVLGQKTKGEAVIMTLVERQTRFALACKLPN
ncbi:IS30 family transposase, partial [Streptococcus macedonicus]